MTTQDRVLEFHRTFGHPIQHAPGAITSGRYGLRLNLIDEEHSELFEAWSDGHFAGMVDALADLVYVCYGMAIEMGVDLDEVIEEVHRANMAKLGPDGKPIYREDGKVIKPEGWQPPDIIGIINMQKERGNF